MGPGGRRAALAGLASLERGRRADRVAGLLALVLLSSGCFSAHMRPPPRDIADPKARVNCTASPVLPLLDGVCAVSLGLLSGGLVRAAVEAPPCDGMGPCFSPAAEWTGAVLVGVPAVMCGIFAVEGARKASRCAKLEKMNTACIGGDEAACERLRSGRVDPGR